MFTAALCTTAKTWKQPKGPSTDDWLKKVWYIDTDVCARVCTRIQTHIHTSILLSHKKEWNIAICSNMEDRPREFHTKSEKDNYDTTYTWNLKNNTNEPIYKTDRLPDMENKLWLSKQKEEGWQIRRTGLTNTNYYI